MPYSRHNDPQWEYDCIRCGRPMGHCDNCGCEECLRCGEYFDEAWADKHDCLDAKVQDQPSPKIWKEVNII